MLYREKEIIDVKDIEKLTDIEIMNPAFKRTINDSVHAKIVIGLNKSPIRRLLALLANDVDFEKMYKDDTDSIFPMNVDSSAKSQEDNNITEPFFNISYIQFAEFVPKDTLHYFRKFKLTYISDNDKADLDDDISDDTHGLIGFNINTNTDLGKMFSFCTVMSEEVTDSFEIIWFRFFLNEETKRKISDFAVSSTPDYERYFNLDNVKYIHSWAINKGYISGVNCKRYIMNAIYEELKYRILRALDENSLLPMNGMTSSQAAIFVDTNVDGRDSKTFWHSLNIYESTSYESNDFKAAFTFCSDCIVCLYKSDIDESCEECFSLYALDDFNQFLAIESVLNNCKERLEVLTNRVQKAYGKKIKSWIELKQMFNDDMLNIHKLLEEYHYDYNPKWNYQSLQGVFFTSERAEGINNEIDSLKNKADSVLEQINSSIKDESIKISYKNYVAAGIAAVAAVVTLVLTIFIA